MAMERAFDLMRPHLVLLVALVGVLAIAAGLSVYRWWMARRPDAPTAAAPAPLPAAQPADAESDPSDHLSLEGAAHAPIRVFPMRPWPFIALVAAISAGAWLLGLVLAPDRARFLASPEWRFMPFYLAAHFIAVRLFITAFTNSFIAGVSHLDVDPGEAARGTELVLGPVGIGLALLIAAPFCYFDYQYLTGLESRYERMGGKVPMRVDFLMWATWCIEWFLNALIWMMLLGFLIKNSLTLNRYAFRSPIEIVVYERHYRPFLQMSAQGASIVLGFSIVTILYLGYTGGELTDYAGLAITMLLLMVGFVPPWFILRRKVRQAVEAETMALRHSLAGTVWRNKQASAAALAAGPKPTLEQRLDQALEIFRISHLEQMKLNLGRREARAVIIRLAAPVIGIAWQLSQNMGEVLNRVNLLIKSGLALFLKGG